MLDESAVQDGTNISPFLRGYWLVCLQLQNINSIKIYNIHILHPKLYIHFQSDQMISKFCCAKQNRKSKVIKPVFLDCRIVFYSTFIFASYFLSPTVPKSKYWDNTNRSVIFLDYTFSSYLLNNTWPPADSKMEKFEEDLYFYSARLLLFSD